MAERRKRLAVLLPDGTERVQTKPPRADLLHYPATPYSAALITVLVRRTHDLEVARELAKEAWRERAIAVAVASSNGRCVHVRPGELTRHRVGWWTTSTGRTVPARGAVDEQGRVVVWCDDPLSAHSAGPGIEFRP